MDTENKENEMKPCKRHEEYQYLDQIRHVIQNGSTKPDRTGVGIKTVFGFMSRYSLRNSKYTRSKSIKEPRANRKNASKRHTSDIDNEESLPKGHHRRALLVH